MSYSPFKNEDSLSEYISSSVDFHLNSKKLIEYRNDIDNFILWFDKCYSIDPRATIIFTNDIYDKLNVNIRMYVSPFLRKYKVRYVS